MTGERCSAKLRNSDPCRSVATDGEFYAYHAALGAEFGVDTVSNGRHVKKRNARERLPVLVESEPLELNSSSPSSPAAVRPALAHGSGGGRDDSSRAARGCDQHDPRDLGDLHVP